MIRQVQAVQLPVRSDPAGDGRFGSSRKKLVKGRVVTYPHQGQDHNCKIYQEGEFPLGGVLSPVNGLITKHGYCYGDDLSWRYVQITDGDLLHHRLFYVFPLVRVGKTVTAGTIVGRAQDITRRYPDDPDMTPHVHYEIMNDAGEYLDPNSI